jgi:hypothetical protein
MQNKRSKAKEKKKREGGNKKKRGNWLGFESLYSLMSMWYLLTDGYHGVREVFQIMVFFTIFISLF